MFITIGAVNLKDLRFKSLDVFEDGCLKGKLFTDDGFVGEIKFDKEETRSVQLAISRFLWNHPKITEGVGL